MLFHKSHTTICHLARCQTVSLRNPSGNTGDFLWLIRHQTNSVTRTESTVKRGTHWRQIWIQHMNSTHSTVASQQRWSCGFGLVHTGNKVDRIGNRVERISNKVNHDKLSNLRCCRFVAKTGNTVECIGNKVERIRQQSTLLPICGGGICRHLPYRWWRLPASQTNGPHKSGRCRR